MSTGYFFSNPTQHQVPISNNFNGDTQKYDGTNGGYPATASFANNGNNNNTMNPQRIHINGQQQLQQQLNQQQIQQLVNQQMNQQQGQVQCSYQGMNQQQQQYQLNQQLLQQQMINNQYQQQRPSDPQMNMNQATTLSRNDINSIKALISSQTQVANNLSQVQVNNATTIMNEADAVQQSSFFGNLFNQLNFFANNPNNNGQSINISNVNSGLGGQVNNYMNANQIQLSMTPMSQAAATFEQQGNASAGRLATPTVSTNDITALNHTGPSPMPMTFMTPKMSLTPNPSNPPTPMMTPRMGMTPDPTLDTPAPPLRSLNDANQGQQNAPNFGSSAASIPPFSIGTKARSDKRPPKKGTANKAATVSDIANAQKSFFRRGITSVGSALTVVANYVNESLLSGIPFHIADRAMRESKAVYAKWWEDGINNEVTDDEDDAELSSADDDEKRRKMRKLDWGEAVDSSESRGSALSASLEKNYNAVGIDTNRQHLKREDPNRKEILTGPSMPHVKPMEVDSSIIKRRRSQFDHAHKKEDTSGLEGYDIFNNIGCMYGTDGSNKDPVKVPSQDFDINDEPFSVNTTTQSTITSSSAINGTMNAIKELIEEKNNVQDEQDIYHMITSPRQWVTRTLRSELIDALQSSQGDTKDKRFLSSLEILSRFYKSTGRDARVNPWSARKVTDDSSDNECNSVGAGGPMASDLLEGSWLNMSRPNYVECLGKNKENDFMYTLGRMSFDMFQPGDLICSVQSTHNNIRIIGEQEELPAFVPKSLKEEVASLSNSNGDSTSKRPLLRSYDIAVSMTLEPPASVGQPEPTATPFPTKRLRAIIAVKGYVLPDPHVPNRLTVWFTGGKLCPAKLSYEDEEDEDFDDEDGPSKKKGKEQKSAKNEQADNDEYGGFEEWTALFSKGKWRKTLGERARAMAAKLLLGADIPNKMEDDGHMEYSLHRPVGGHSKVYVEVLYLDEDILIMRGHRGTIYAMARSCVSQRYSNMKDS